LWEDFFKDRSSCFVPNFLNRTDRDIKFVGELGPVFHFPGVSDRPLKNLVLLGSKHGVFFIIL
jgi:hypothetical protein